MNFRRDTRGKLIGLFDARLSVSLGPCVCQCHALQFHRQSDAYKNTLKYMNMCFTGMFTVECILKIAAFGVRVSSTIKHQQAPPPPRPTPLPSSNGLFERKLYSLVLVAHEFSSPRVYGFCHLLLSRNDTCDARRRVCTLMIFKFVHCVDFFFPSFEIEQKCMVR